MARKYLSAINNTKTIHLGMFEYLALISFVFAYFPTWQSLVTFWAQSDDYSHGFFIIPIVLYILWSKRKILTELPKNSSYYGLAILLVSIFIYLLAFFAQIKTIESLTIISTLSGLILYLYGFRVLKEISFPLFFLLFMIPIPEQFYRSFTVPLQILVSTIAVNLSSFFGIPIFREGNIIHLPGHVLEVVRACSGIRSIVTLMTLSTIIAYLTLNSISLKISLIISSLPAAIIVNIFRVLLMIFGFYYYGLDLTQKPFHTIFGIVIFVFALVLIFLARKVLSLWDNPST